MEIFEQIAVFKIEIATNSYLNNADLNKFGKIKKKQ